MKAELNLSEILSQVKRMNKEEQLTLLEKLILLIRKTETSNKTTKISSISGLGSSLWSNTNIDDYLDQEREW